MKRRHFLARAAAASALLSSPATLRAQGTLTDLSTRIASLDQLHSLQVQRGDEIVFAEAPRGSGLDRLANIKSCSKSLVGLLLGDAIASGVIASVDAPLSTVAPRLIPSDTDPRVPDITMEDLVSLRAGLEATSGANYGGWVASNNWVANALSREMVAAPGGRMIYSTGSTHILGAALTEATGESLLSQARRVLGQTLGIDIPPWTRDPQGYYMGGNEMALTPRAMLKIAVMMRDGGTYEGTTVLPQSWISASTRPRTRSPWSGMSYGYGWFLTDRGYILARGYGGQIIAAHPDLNLAVALTSDPLRPARSGGYFDDIMDLLNGPVLELA
ncbi:serine hydrolase domain-containing protein [Celeribacter litoreus]|uniref:serine hydrolase domain-containing protein n=1 Tax=Celeribacter litoreus TaxID=2876714 RepID=UPI001CCDFE38|nr:serine hydrolase [Celeribacter litoreus]MCA0043735.1 beta-lactamase family protein [Celeribacter litoreus]